MYLLKSKNNRKPSIDYLNWVGLEGFRLSSSAHKSPSLPSQARFSACADDMKDVAKKSDAAYFVDLLIHCMSIDFSLEVTLNDDDKNN